MSRRTWLTFVVGICALSASHTFGAEPTGLFGAWDLTVETRRGDRPSWVKLFTVGDDLVAEFVGATGGKSRAKDVRIDGDTARWTIGESNYEATFADGKLSGYLTRGDRRNRFTGQRVIRRVDLSGTWDVRVNIADRTLRRTLELEHQGDTITGTYGGDEFSARDLTKAALEKDRLTYTIDFDFNGQEFQVDYDVTVRGDRYDGTLSIRGTDYEGDTQATRHREWEEPIKLFNGHDLSNWDFQENGRGSQWRVVDGVMVNQESGWNIFSKQRFKDYKLRVDVKVPPHGNSGIYVNGRYEVQVADSHGKEASEGSMGAIYGRAVPTANPSRPAGEWQTFEIRFVDYWATVTLNGTTIVDNVLIEGITGGALDSNESEPGPIMLQGDHGHIEYRNIVLTPLAR